MFEAYTLFSKLRLPIVLLFVVFFGGAAGYRVFYPDASWYTIFFMTAITLATVGYHDVLNVEHNPAAGWYTMFLIVAGMGVVLYSVSTVTAFFIEGEIRELFQLQATRRKIRKMKNHYIICGAGQTGIHVVREMHSTGQSFIVIENDPETREKLKEDFPGILILSDDATSDEVLLEAKIKEAKGLIATLPNDKDNLFLTVTARMLNPSLQIVSRGIDLSIHAKLKKAGANYVVSPNLIGGMRIASEILRPNVVTFLDRMLRGKEKSLRIDEIIVPSNSPLLGKTFSGVDLRKKTGVTILACSPDGNPDNFLYNPGGDTPFRNGAILLYIGTPEQHTALSKLLLP